MSRARDNANLGAQAGSGLDASDIQVEHYQLVLLVDQV